MRHKQELRPCEKQAARIEWCPLSLHLHLVTAPVNDARTCAGASKQRGSSAETDEGRGRRKEEEGGALCYKQDTFNSRRYCQPVLGAGLGTRREFDETRVVHQPGSTGNV